MTSREGEAVATTEAVCGAVLTDPVHGSHHCCLRRPHHDPDWHEDSVFLWKSEPAGDMIVNKAVFGIERLRRSS